MHELAMDHPSRRKVRIGIIVPSSNTALEPLTQQIISDIPKTAASVTVHFARFRVTKIDLSPESHSQFDNEPMLEAARLLADARVDMIGWSGTSAAWLGFHTDDDLCAQIKEVTGIPATTSMLAMRQLLVPGKDHVGLVTPYLSSVNKAICHTLEAEGFTIPDARSQCSGLSTNFEFAQVPGAAADDMVAKVVAGGAEQVLIVCTNLGTAQRARHWEEKHGIEVLDSVATVVYGILQALDVDATALHEKWGSMFGRR